MRADPLFRDVTSDSQLRGLQASLNIDRDRANTLGVSIERHPHRAVQRLRRAPGVDDLHPGRQLPGDHGGGAAAPSRTRARSTTSTCARRPARWCRCRASRRSSARSGRPSINHVGPAAGGDGVVQPRARRARSATRPRKIEQLRATRSACRPSIITSYGGDAAVFQSSQGSQAILIIAALLVIYVLLGVLYESYIHPLTILAGLPSAAVGALLTLQALRPGPDADRDDRHPAADRHRQEERDHDDRLRARRAAQRRAWRRRRRSARPACCASGRS